MAVLMNDTPRPGWWTCKVCNTRERGGQSAFYQHWLATHWVEVKP